MEKITKETFNPDDFTFVDLGLPSGTLWAKENAPGFYTHDEAEQAFGKFLPKGSAMVELIEECKVEWNGEKLGLDITGPSGESIFLPASGYCDRDGRPCEIGGEGNYWTRMRYVPDSESFGSSSQAHARYLHFGSGGVYPLLGGNRAYGFSVRPCREFVR